MLRRRIQRARLDMDARRDLAVGEDDIRVFLNQQHEQFHLGLAKPQVLSCLRRGIKRAYRDHRRRLLR